MNLKKLVICTLAVGCISVPLTGQSAFAAASAEIAMSAQETSQQMYSFVFVGF